MANHSRRKRRRAAWASITEVERGARYRIRYWAKGADGDYKRRSCTVHGTRKDAERKRAELMLAHSEDAPCPTVGDAWAQWMLPSLERRLEVGDIALQTMKQMRSNWRAIVEPRWADVACDAVTPLAIQQWYDTLTYGAVQRSQAVTRPTLDFAVRYGCVASNPFRERYVMPSRSTVRAQDKGVWTYDELGTIWREVAWGQWWEAAFLALAFGGLRVGESLGLRSEDVGAIDHDGMAVHTIAVRRQVLSRGGVVTDRLKNRQSVRTLAVPGRAGARLAHIAADAPGGWLTGDGLGGNTRQQTLTDAWTRAMREHGGVAVHPIRNLRNGYETNTRWVLGVPPWLLEPMLGHAGQGVTGAYYDRPSADMLAVAMADAYAAHPYDAGWTWARWDD